jgi:hypothetical protein
MGRDCDEFEAKQKRQVLRGGQTVRLELEEGSSRVKEVAEA